MVYISKTRIMLSAVTSDMHISQFPVDIRALRDRERERAKELELKLKPLRAQYQRAQLTRNKALMADLNKKIVRMESDFMFNLI